MLMKESFSKRMQEAMNLRNMKQVDLVEKLNLVNLQLVNIYQVLMNQNKRVYI